MPATIVLARPRRGAALITLGGEVDLAALERLSAVLVLVSRCPDVVVDAAGVDFLDCCTLGPLLVAARAARDAGGGLHLRDPSPAVVALLTWCRLHERLPVLGSG